MRFKPETFGTLVRPRILTQGVVVPVNTLSEFVFAWPKLKKRTDYYHLFSKKLHDIFTDLHLGDTSGASLLDCYAGEVVYYLVQVAGSLVLVDSHNVQETIKLVRSHLGVRANLRIVSVGLRLYKDLQRDESTGAITPLTPWGLKTTAGFEPIWFYHPWELVPLTDIVKFESASPGDLVVFQKTSGLVVRKKVLNKPKFYSTSSWSCCAIRLLNSGADGFLRFLPNRNFTLHRAHEAQVSDLEPK